MAAQHSPPTNIEAMRSRGEAVQRRGDKTERAHDILPPRRPMLDAMFAPKIVAMIAATERPGSVGRTILENLLGNNFGGAASSTIPGTVRDSAHDCSELLVEIGREEKLARIIAHILPATPPCKA